MSHYLPSLVILCSSSPLTPGKYPATSRLSRPRQTVGYKRDPGPKRGLLLLQTRSLPVPPFLPWRYCYNVDESSPVQETSLSLRKAAARNAQLAPSSSIVGVNFLSSDVAALIILNRRQDALVSGRQYS